MQDDLVLLLDLPVTAFESCKHVVVQVWNTYTGEDLFTLEGHKNVVYAIAFNNP